MGQSLGVDERWRQQASHMMAWRQGEAQRVAGSSQIKHCEPYTGPALSCEVVLRL